MFLRYFYYFKSLEVRLVLVLISINLLTNTSIEAKHRSKRWDYRELTHEPKQLTDKQIQFLSSEQFEEKELFESTLDSILIPRSPGTDGHKKVQKFIIKMMESLEWNVDQDTFTGTTPLGKRTFTNIVATLNPSHCKRLVLSCHYDSKLNREHTFLGAIDSAVPCAMIIHLALTLDNYLKKSNADTTIQLVFFDGEEAFVQWSNEDSLYGSRHLANKWSRTSYPKSMKTVCKNQTQTRELDRIELMVLLDLIGSSSPKFYNFFPNTKPLFSRLIEIEKKLNEFGLIERNNRRKKSSYFNARQSFSYIEDDHMPFLRRNVPILHVIATPFPSVWHRESDNKDNLDFPTIRNILKIFRIFISEYLHLNIDDVSEQSN